VHRRQLAEWDVANAGDDLIANKCPMYRSGLGCHPSLDIDREPMFEIFGHGHLGRVDVGPFIPPIEEPIKLSLCLSLGASERDIANDPFAVGRSAVVEL
jgi:hypothetical protein